MQVAELSLATGTGPSKGNPKSSIKRLKTQVTDMEIVNPRKRVFLNIPPASW
jgi:hypothetical protein